jgi:hypothetical protein
VTYVYAICDVPPGAAVELRGVGGQTVDLRPWGECAVACGEGPAGVVPVTAENVLAHEHVLEALMAAGTVLPMRFGTTFHRTSDLEAVLELHGERLRAGLDRVRDCEEWGVRVLWRQPDEQPGTPSASEQTPLPTSGREYLIRRAAEEQRRRAVEARAEDLASAMHLELARSAEDSRRKVLATPDLLLSAAYLVRRDRMTDFHSAVRQLVAAHPDLRVLGTGPWPPYHFAPHLDATEGAHA